MIDNFFQLLAYWRIKEGILIKIVRNTDPGTITNADILRKSYTKAKSKSVIIVFSKSDSVNAFHKKSDLQT